MSREMINTYEEQVNETEDVNRVYPLEDDLVFTTVMKNKDACIGLLETIFDGYKVQDIEELYQIMLAQFLDMLNKSLDYSRLKTSFVIFICTFDLFKRNRALYFFESLCKDEPDCRY